MGRGAKEEGDAEREFAEQDDADEGAACSSAVLVGCERGVSGLGTTAAESVDVGNEALGASDESTPPAGSDEIGLLDNGVYAAHAPITHAIPSTGSRLQDAVPPVPGAPRNELLCSSRYACVGVDGGALDIEADAVGVAGVAEIRGLFELLQFFKWLCVQKLCAPDVVPVRLV